MTRFWIKVVLATAVLGIAFYLLLQVKIISVPILLAMILAILAEPLVTRLETRGWSRTQVVTTLFAATIALLGLLIVFGGQALAAGITDYATEAIPRAQARLFGILESTENYLRTRLPFAVEVDLQSKLSDVVDRLQNEVVPQIPSTMGSIVAGSLVVPIVTFFFIRDGRTLRHRLIAMVPNRYFEMTLMMLHRAGQQIANYIRGVGKQSFFVALVDFIALLIVGIGFWPALLLGTFGGLINAIPYVGPVIGYGVGALVALALPGDPQVIWVVLAMVAGQLADNIIVGPLLLGSAVDMHPIAVIILCVIGGTVMGVLGLVLVVPVFAVVRVIIQELYIGVRTHRRFLE